LYTRAYYNHAHIIVTSDVGFYFTAKSQLKIRSKPILYADATRIESTRSLYVVGQASLCVQSNSVDRRRSPDVGCGASSTDTTQKTRTDHINLLEDDPATVELIVPYLYEGDYDPVLPSTVTQTTTLAVVTLVRHVITTSKSTSFPHTCRALGFDGHT
jgi:hypothetical protein